MKVDHEFLINGHRFINLELPSMVQEWVLAKDWNQLDAWVQQQTQSQGLIGREFAKYLGDFNCEHILSLRQSPDEDGIWHDDGSRDMAFSLSLNLKPDTINGGSLMLRNKQTPSVLHEIPPQKYGKMVLFLTGKQGFEHKTCAVSKGERLVAAGWATEKSS